MSSLCDVTRRLPFPLGQPSHGLFSPFPTCRSFPAKSFFFSFVEAISKRAKRSLVCCLVSRFYWGNYSRRTVFLESRLGEKWLNKTLLYFIFPPTFLPCNVFVAKGLLLPRLTLDKKKKNVNQIMHSEAMWVKLFKSLLSSVSARSN